jgi:hypothetical protein
VFFVESRLGGIRNLACVGSGFSDSGNDIIFGSIGNVSNVAIQAGRVGITGTAGRTVLEEVVIGDCYWGLQCQAGAGFVADDNLYINSCQFGLYPQLGGSAIVGAAVPGHNHKFYNAL